MEGVVNTAMSAIMGYVSELFGGIGDVVSTMTAEGNGIMLIPIVIMVGGALIGLASRLIGR